MQPKQNLSIACSAETTGWKRYIFAHVVQFFGLSANIWIRFGGTKCTPLDWAVSMTRLCEEGQQMPPVGLPLVLVAYEKWTKNKLSTQQSTSLA